MKVALSVAMPRTSMSPAALAPAVGDSSTNSGRLPCPKPGRNWIGGAVAKFARPLCEVGNELPVPLPREIPFATTRPPGEYLDNTVAAMVVQ